MKLKIFLIAGLISLLGFVNCIGPFKKEEKKGLLENPAVLVLALNQSQSENMEINGTWISNFFTYTFSATKSPSTGTTGTFEGKDPGNTLIRSGSIVDFNNQNKTFISRYNENSVDCNGNGNQTDEGVCFNRFRWVISSGTLYICEEVKDKASLDAVNNDTTSANPDDLNNGCRGIGWENLGTKQ